MFTVPVFSSNVTATLALLAALITAAYASLRYYSEKAAKVTEFRKAWVESLRQAVAEFSGSTHTIVGRIAIRSKVDLQRRASDAEKSSMRHRLFSVFKKTPQSMTSVEKELATELLTHWSVLRLSYNKVILHLNPAEHLAYSLAENAIADYTASLSDDPNVRVEVGNFLNWCIELAKCRAQSGPRSKLIPDFLYIKCATCSAPTALFSGALGTASTKIDEACNDPGSALLLAAFSTRQLLHGSYKNVFENANRIEKGIRVVDTSAAIVIKGVWENIKKGEPSYRWVSRVALI